MKSRFILLLTTLFASLSLLSQDADKYLSDFLAVKQNNTVYLRWTIKAGNSCEGTRIQKAVDDQAYQLIGEISGVCGSPDKPVSYEYYDSLPAIGKSNHYRLEMGNLGTSDPVSVDFILYNNEGYSLQPNPVTDVSSLYFENPRNEIYQLIIIDQNGRKTADMITSDNYFLIRRELFSSGVLVFNILKEGVFISSGKIVII